MNKNLASAIINMNRFRAIGTPEEAGAWIELVEEAKHSLAQLPTDPEIVDEAIKTYGVEDAPENLATEY